MMSHRMAWLLAEALKFGEDPAVFDASILEAGFPLSHPRARLISATPASPALKVRAFIYVFLLLRVPPLASGHSASIRPFGCRGGARAMHRWKHFRDRIGAGRTARTDLDTDSGVEPAGRITARRTAVTPGDLATATASASRPQDRDQAARRVGGRSVGRPDLSIREGFEVEGVALFPNRHFHPRPAFLAVGRWQTCRTLETASAARTGQLGLGFAALHQSAD